MGPTKYIDILTVGCEIMHESVANIYARWGFSKLFYYINSEDIKCDTSTSYIHTHTWRSHELSSAFRCDSCLHYFLFVGLYI